MAIKAKLVVDGEGYNIKTFEYGFVTGANTNGFSSGKTRQVGLKCEIEAIRQEFFEEWAMGNYIKKYIEVHISDGVNSMGRTRVLKCHDTFLLELHTRFSATSNEPMSFEMFMKSGAIEASWSTAAHVEPWSSIPEQAEPTVIEEEVEGKILEAYFEDNAGNRIKKPRRNQEIYYVIKSQEMTGKLINIDLSDSNIDFEYQGNILPDDQLLDYSVSSDLVRIPLKTIKQR